MQERALRIFKELLEKDNSISIHSRSLQVLVTKIYKSIYQLSPTIIQEKL